MTQALIHERVARAARIDVPAGARLAVLAGCGALLVAATLTEQAGPQGAAAAETMPGAAWPEFATLVLGNFALSFLVAAMIILGLGLVAPRRRPGMSAAGADGGGEDRAGSDEEIARRG